MDGSRRLQYTLSPNPREGVYMDTDPKTSSPPFCLGRECPEIKRLEGRIDKIYTRLDVIMGGIVTVLITIIGGLLA